MMHYIITLFASSKQHKPCCILVCGSLALVLACKASVAALHCLTPQHVSGRHMAYVAVCTRRFVIIAWTRSIECDIMGCILLLKKRMQLKYGDRKGCFGEHYGDKTAIDLMMKHP